MLNDSFYFNLKQKFELKEVDIRTYSPLSLAYAGDAVYDLVIRSILVGNGNISNNNLHKAATGYVSARAQAVIVEKMLPELSEEEASVYRRGKNSKPSSRAKNATLNEYQKATGFEALLGYLYLTGQQDRLLEIIDKGIKIIDDNNI